jgi:translation initiation factor 1
MPNKKFSSLSSLVYSTDPDYKQVELIREEETPGKTEQKLKVRLDTKRRAGKLVTLIEGFIGKKADMEELGKKIKTFCGTGGSVKDNEIMVQGDNKDKILQWLQKNGYTNTKKI